jgi:hypothetical protein
LRSSKGSGSKWRKVSESTWGTWWP